MYIATMNSHKSELQIVFWHNNDEMRKYHVVAVMIINLRTGVKLWFKPFPWLLSSLSHYPQCLKEDKICQAQVLVPIPVNISQVLGPWLSTPSLLASTRPHPKKIIFSYSFFNVPQWNYKLLSNVYKQKRSEEQTRISILQFSVICWYLSPRRGCEVVSR